MITTEYNTYSSVYGFERHFIRGIKKIKFRCSLAFLIMLVVAIGRIKKEQPEMIRMLNTG